jgi:hypothetical protein
MDQGLIALDLPPDDADHLTLGNDEMPLDIFDDPEHGTSIELRARVTAHIDEQVDVSWIYDEIFPDGTTLGRHVTQTHSREWVYDPIYIWRL